MLIFSLAQRQDLNIRWGGHTNILIVNDSTCKGNEPPKFIVEKENNNTEINLREENVPLREVQIE